MLEGSEGLGDVIIVGFRLNNVIVFCVCLFSFPFSSVFFLCVRLAKYLVGTQYLVFVCLRICNQVVKYSGFAHSLNRILSGCSPKASGVAYQLYVLSNPRLHYFSSIDV